MSKEEEITTSKPRHVLMTYPGENESAGRHPCSSALPFDSDGVVILDDVSRIILYNGVDIDPELRIDFGFVRRKVCPSRSDLSNYNGSASLYWECWKTPRPNHYLRRFGSCLR